MKKTTKLLLLMCIVCGSQSIFAQDYTPLYGGSRSGGTVYTIDTTGMVWTEVGSTSVTSDYGSISGIYGLALDPTDDQMYALYESGGDESNRRLGLYDPEAGVITDIGNAGNLTDIDFGLDGSLYGTTGSSGSGYEFREVDKVTAATTYLFDHLSGSWGPTIAYDPFEDNMLYASDEAVNRIDLGTFVETSEGFDPASECHAMVVLDDNTAWIANYGNIRSIDLTTGAQTIIASPGYNAQALAFGPPPCTEMTLDVTSTSVCEGTEITVNATSPSGAAITWDGGITDEVPFLPGPAGTYSYTATSAAPDECELNIEVEVFGLPVVIAGSGDENYCIGESIVLSAGGDADEYTWEPLEFTPDVGTHTYYLTGSYDIGCEAMDSIIITVHDLPEITAAADDDLICIGDEMTLTASGAETYVWSDGIVNGEPFTPEATGDLTFSVSGTDANGCVDSTTIEVEVLEQIEVTGTTTDEIAGADGEIDIDIAGGFPAFEVDWDDDGTGEFDDVADRTGLTGGTYTVVVRGSEGCIDTAMFVVNSQLSITSFDSNDLRIYPNPAVEEITIEMPGTFNYQIVSLNGSILLNGTGNNKEVISLKELASGTYFVNIKTNESTTIHKVVKQ